MSRVLAAVAVAGAVGLGAWLLGHDDGKRPSAPGGGAGPEGVKPASPSGSSTSTAPALLLRGSQASASSKVLLTGGYLILEPAFCGLVLALDARFRAALLPLTPAVFKQLRLRPATNSSVPVVVFAPQRAAKPSHYELSWDASALAQRDDSSAGGWKLRATEAGQEKNKFVEQTIVYSLLYLSAVLPVAQFRERVGCGFVLYLEGDYQFYSAVRPERTEGSSVPPVVPDGSKTGLGSSAALVSSIVGALFSHFGALDAPLPVASSPSSSAAAASSAAPASPASSFRSLPISARLALAHNLAQLVHCSAQGKVGSGFDVATAFHGSQVYRRFTPQVLTECLSLAAKGAGAEPDATLASIPRGVLVRQLHDTDAASGWNYSVAPFRLPPGLVVVLGDVAGGASTPVMVKKVLEWRRSQPDASNELWNALHAANQRVQSLFEELSSYAAAHELEYRSVRLVLSAHPAAQWESLPAGALPAGKLFVALHAQFLQVRQHLREMGRQAGVDIEPATQQALLDSSLSSKGVLLAGVPGAGGDDAIVAVLMDRESIAPLESKWAAFAFPGRPERTVKRLKVGVETDQIRTEQVTLDAAHWGLQRQEPGRSNL